MRTGFNTPSGANAMQRTGAVTGMLLGKAVHGIEAGMKAFSEPKKLMQHAVEAVKVPMQKMASKVTMAFANADEGFGSTFSKQKAAVRHTAKPKGPGMAPT